MKWHFFVASFLILGFLIIQFQAPQANKKVEVNDQSNMRDLASSGGI
ncbi:MAG TPA: hypothetical protein VNJ08_13455 [Bacteriovoracaceae bacterium]|nr:hypothetical protein [Bacteriovoracaceae bacterium]